MKRARTAYAVRRGAGVESIRLGPVPCQGCRRLVALVEVWRDWRSGTAPSGYYRRRFGGIHHCTALTKYERDRMVAYFQRTSAA